jgi:hypothetical protein
MKAESNRNVRPPGALSKLQGENTLQFFVVKNLPITDISALNTIFG